MEDTSGMNHCPQCKSAIVYQYPETDVVLCRRCFEEWESENSWDSDLYEYEEDWDYCSLCSGTGYVEELLSSCPDCGGLGFFP